jgi:hypothetical protein
MGDAVKVALEPFSRWCREALERGLFEAHWREVGEDHERIPLELDLEKLLALERARRLQRARGRWRARRLRDDDSLDAPEL